MEGVISNPKAVQRVIMVSVIIPMLNEERYIRRCLESVLQSELPLDGYEVLVVDGGSTDRSKEIVAEVAAAFPNVRLLENPKRIAAAAMNIGISEAAGLYVVRMDAHSVFPPEYISRCVEELCRTGASNVGGRWITKAGGATLTAKAIPLLTAHRFGVGGSGFRLGWGHRFVDTVPFGAFPKKVLLEVGGYREDLTRHEDYELNARIRRAGGSIYLSSAIENVYFQRATFFAFLRKAYQDGFWLPKAWLRYPYSWRLRHAVPLAFTTTLTVLAVAALASPSAAVMLAALGAAYVTGCVVASLQVSMTSGLMYAAILPFMFCLFHLAYGMGGICGFFSEIRSVLRGESRPLPRLRRRFRLGAMKIAHLSSVHTMSDTRIFHKECRTLASAGHEVVLVIPGEKEAFDGAVRIAPVPPSRTRADRLKRTVWQVYNRAVQEDADVYHFHDAELIVVGALLRARGKRVVYDVHEDVPQDIMMKDWIPWPLRRPISATASFVESAGAAIFDGIVAATPKIASRFPHGKTVLVQNYPATEELHVAVSGEYGNRPPSAIYVGNITLVRGAREMVEAIALVDPVLHPRLEIAGTFDDQKLFQQLRGRPGWQATTYHGQVSRSELRKLLSNTRAGIVTFHPGPNHTEAQPNKFFEYMSAALPVIASDFPLWRKLIEENDCGILVDPMDPKSIARAIEWILTHPTEAEQMGKRGRAAILDRHNWETEGRKLVDFYGRLGDGHKQLVEC